MDATAYPAPGQLIDVGGHRLHLNCTGSGSPTVVLEPGLGEASSVMSLDSTGRGGQTPEFASMTAPAEGGVNPLRVRRTPRRPPPTCTHC